MEKTSFASTWVLGSLRPSIASSLSPGEISLPLLTSDGPAYHLDPQGYLYEGYLFNGNERRVKGWCTDPSGKILAEQHPYALNLIHLAQIHRIGKATSLIELQQNLPTSTPLGESPGQTKVMIYNHLGEQHALYLSWTKVAPFLWQVTFHAPGATHILNPEGKPYEAHPLQIAFNVQGAPISFNGSPASPQLFIEWPDHYLTCLVLDLGRPQSFEGITCRGDDMHYAAYSNGHEGDYSLEDIERLHITNSGECSLHFFDQSPVIIAQIATTGAH